jgi:hypothetical protein
VKKSFFIPESEGSKVRDSGRGLQELFIFGAKYFYMLFELRPNADQLHLALQDIHKLWQFIQLEFSEKSADARHSNVTRSGHRTALGGAENHAPEFKELKFSETLANADLGIENRAAIVKFDRQGDHRKNRRQQDEPSGGAKRIKAAAKDTFFAWRRSRMAGPVG